MENFEQAEKLGFKTRKKKRRKLTRILSAILINEYFFYLCRFYDSSEKTWHQYVFLI